MVQISTEAQGFIENLLDKNQKNGFGIKIELQGFACSGPQFGMSFQEKAGEGEKIDKSASRFDIFYNEDTEKALENCVIEFIDDPNYGSGLMIRDPNYSGCSSCGGGCH